MRFSYALYAAAKLAAPATAAEIILQCRTPLVIKSVLRTSRRIVPIRMSATVKSMSTDKTHCRLYSCSTSTAAFSLPGQRASVGAVRLSPCPFTTSINNLDLKQRRLDIAQRGGLPSH